MKKQVIELYDSPQPSAEPVGEVRWAADVPGTVTVVRWEDCASPPVGTKLYTHKQPDDTAALQDRIQDLYRQLNATEKEVDDWRLLGKQALEALKLGAAMYSPAGTAWQQIDKAIAAIDAARSKT